MQATETAAARRDLDYHLHPTTNLASVQAEESRKIRMPLLDVHPVTRNPHLPVTWILQTLELGRSPARRLLVLRGNATRIGLGRQ